MVKLGLKFRQPALGARGSRHLITKFTHTDEDLLSGGLGFYHLLFNSLDFGHMVNLLEL